MAAAQSHHDTVRLRQVVVTATQHATSRSEAPTAVGVVDDKQMEAVNAEKNLTNRVPAVKEIEKMIAQAKEMEPIVKY